jgi:hypothetical protein
MRDEQARRRSSFQPGLGLRLADGQIWSLPIPANAPGDPAVSSRVWDNPGYRAILQALGDAEDQGERFRAELALAIHLLSWNYEVDRDDLAALFDDAEVERFGVDIAGSLSELARAHLGVETVDGRIEVARRSFLDPLKDRIRRLIHVASRRLSRRASLRPRGKADLTVYSSIARASRSSSPSAR